MAIIHSTYKICDDQYCPAGILRENPAPAGSNQKGATHPALRRLPFRTPFSQRKRGSDDCVYNLSNSSTCSVITEQVEELERL
jgi:hypothetical protein